MFSRTALPVLAALGSTLGACTDEPSEAALRQAVERKLTPSFDREVEQARKLGVQSPARPSITAFTKLGCKPAEAAPGYACTFDGAIDGQNQGPGTRRFFRAADGTLTMAE